MIRNHGSKVIRARILEPEAMSAHASVAVRPTPLDSFLQSRLVDHFIEKDTQRR